MAVLPELFFECFMGGGNSYRHTYMDGCSQFSTLRGA